MSVVTFGEIMLRLSTPGNARFVQARSFDVCYGGGEANVAVALVGFGMPASFVTKLPDHEIGQAAFDELRRRGVGVEHIVRGGERLGAYFLETGASQRGSKVVYDRANAAVTTLTLDELDPGAIFDGVSWFHWTGITPALGPGPRAVLVGLIDAARAAGCRISCDLNFRKRLWSPDEAKAVMMPLMEHVDVCIANEEDADKCLGLSPARGDVESAELDVEAYGELMETLQDRFGFDVVAVTLRESYSASRNGWSAMLMEEAGPVRRSRVYDVQLVDRVGAGDAFSAGLIYSLLSGRDDALEFAVAASCLKQTIPGDWLLASVSEVEALARGSGSGRVDR